MKANSGGAGDYWGKVKLYRETESQAADGQFVSAYRDMGNFWCYVVENKTKEETHLGVLNHVIEADIHLRGFPAVVEKDKLFDLNTERLYQIQGLFIDFSLNETMAKCYMVKSLQDAI